MVVRTILTAIGTAMLAGCVAEVDSTPGPRLRVYGPLPGRGDAGVSVTDAVPLAGGADESPSARSCKEVLLAQPKATSGVYAVAPNGAVLRVFCDMTTDGGGWTLVHKNDLSSSNDRTDDGFNTGALLTQDADGVAVLPRATMAALSPVSEFRVLATNGFKVYSLGGEPYCTTDRHDGLPHGGKMKYDWASDYVPQAVLTSTSGNQHAVRVCPASSGCADGDTGHLAVQRFCCNTSPNAGFWFDGTQRFRPGYYAGTGWVR